MSKSNLVLIGMPGSGKSTLGRRIADRLGYHFIETDSLIEQEAKLKLQDVVNLRGLQYFRALEERVLCNLKCENSVISTGGSAVYSSAAMQALGAIGTRIYLYVSLASMLQRVDNQNNRGLAKLPRLSLQELYQERRRLYPQAADLILDNNRGVTELNLDRMIAKIQDFERNN